MSSRTVFTLWDNSSPGRREPALARSAVKVHHIPLDEVRDPITAGRLPRLGTCAGWPDLKKNLGARLCRIGPRDGPGMFDPNSVLPEENSLLRKLFSLIS